MNCNSNIVAVSDRSTAYRYTTTDALNNNFNFHSNTSAASDLANIAASDAPAASAASKSNTAQDLLKKNASNQASDSLLQHMATSFMSSGNSNCGGVRMPETPLNVFERRNSLDASIAFSQATALSNAPLITFAVPNTTTSSLHAASASHMMFHGGGCSTEDLFEPIAYNTTSAFMANGGQLDGQNDSALARMLSAALDEITTGFDLGPVADYNSLFRSSMDPFQKQLQHQQVQLSQQQQQVFSQNAFFQAAAAATYSKRTIPSECHSPNKRARTIAATNGEEDDDGDSKSPRFRPYQEKQWVEQFEELLKFKERRGHCLVPHTFDENTTLSRWVKRQRYQYKLKKEGKPSTMTDARIVQLELAGFIWDSHAAAWEERLHELAAYKEEYGDCNVPSNYAKNPQLATWVKCQRRQCKLFWCGKKTSNMTLDRFASLNKMGFTWELRHGSSSAKMVAMGAISF